MFRAAIIEEMHKYKKVTDDLENKKNLKRVRMMWAHLYMYKTKMKGKFDKYIKLIEIGVWIKVMLLL